jgi:hypothetical protein
MDAPVGAEGKAQRPDLKWQQTKTQPLRPLCQLAQLFTVWPKQPL